jgi:putative ABC transport system permease protein
MNIFIRTNNTPDRLIPAVRREIRAADAGLAINEFQTMGEIMSTVISQPRFRALLAGAFAGLAMLLAAVGIYGVLSQSVVQRTNEIGIRMALGAERGDILSLIISQGLKVILAGITIGVIGAVVVARLLSSLLFDVAPTDLLTFIFIPSLLTIVSLLACYIPARRAIKVDPMVALRRE